MMLGSRVPTGDVRSLALSAPSSAPSGSCLDETAKIAYVLAFKWDHVSLVARVLLIISGDIEVNPGPSNNYTHRTRIYS